MALPGTSGFGRFCAYGSSRDRIGNSGCATVFSRSFATDANLAQLADRYVLGFAFLSGSRTRIALLA